MFVALFCPLLTKILYKYRLVRRGEYDATSSMDARKHKAGIPMMGGLLVIITVAVITLLFNWERKFTYVPIGVMLLAATLGGIDDFLHSYGKERRNRPLRHILRLIRVHADWRERFWLIITLPWSLFKRTSLWLGSHPGRGVHVHEKLLLQFIAGSITAYWVYFRLGAHWRDIYIPFDGFLSIGWWIIPLLFYLSCLRPMP